MITINIYVVYDSKVIGWSGALGWWIIQPTIGLFIVLSTSLPPLLNQPTVVSEIGLHLIIFPGLQNQPITPADNTDAPNTRGWDGALDDTVYRFPLSQDEKLSSPCCLFECPDCYSMTCDIICTEIISLQEHWPLNITANTRFRNSARTWRVCCFLLSK